MVNLLLFGDKKVGKSTYIHRIITGEFKKDYTPTIGVNAQTHGFHTTAGPFIFNCHDCTDLKDESKHLNMHAAIVMFDLTNQNSYNNLPKRVDTIRKAYGEIPIVICGNKVDCCGPTPENRGPTPEDRGPTPEDRGPTIDFQDITYPMENCIKYFHLSALTNYNFEKPFIYLIRTLMNNNTITIAQCPRN